MKIFGEKGAWAYPGTAQIFGVPRIISGTGKATDFKFGQYIQRVHPNKSPLKILETRSSATAEKQRVSCPHVFLGWLTWCGQVLIMSGRSALYLMHSASHISAFYQHPKVHKCSTCHADMDQYGEYNNHPCRHLPYIPDYRYLHIRIYNDQLLLHFCRWQ